MTDNQDMKERARELADKACISLFCYSCETLHHIGSDIVKLCPICRSDNTHRLGLRPAIQEALLQFAEEQGKAVRKATVRECALLCVSKYSRSGYATAHFIQDEILSLLPNESWTKPKRCSHGVWSANHCYVCTDTTANEPKKEME